MIPGTFSFLLFLFSSPQQVITNKLEGYWLVVEDYTSSKRSHWDKVYLFESCAKETVKRLKCHHLKNNFVVTLIFLVSPEIQLITVDASPNSWAFPKRERGCLSQWRHSEPKSGKCNFVPRGQNVIASPRTIVQKKLGSRRAIAAPDSERRRMIEAIFGAGTLNWW